MNRLFINKEWSPLKKLLFMNAASGGSLNEYTATGNPATFNTNVSKPLKQLLIPFTPVQAEGTPSPENPLPITGWAGMNVTANGTTIPVTFPSEAGTVYGGTLDVTTGVLTAEWKAVDLGTINYTVNKGLTGVDRFIHLFPDYGGATLYNVPEMVCEIFKPENIMIANQNFMTWVVCAITSNETYFYTPGEMYENATAFKQAMNGIMFCYKLAAPYEIQLAPITVQTLIGDNVIFSDTNGENTVKYLKKG